jgi:hypothetical protein
VVPGAAAHPANNVLVVEIVVLLAVRVQFAREGEIGDLALGCGAARVGVVRDAAFEAVEVAVEETGVWGLGRGLV